MAVGYLLAAAAAGVVDVVTEIAWAHWLALHLALLGGISQLVLGAGQFFVCAFLATDPPSRRLVGAQLATWNAGTLLVAVGVTAGLSPPTEVGGALIIGALGLFAASLWRMERRSLQRARWAVRWYYACASFLVLGAVAGVLLASGVPWPFERLLGAHLALNLAGWLGTAIVGTLHTFFPSLTHTRLRFTRLQGPTFTAWLLGVVGLAAGYGLGAGPVATGGWVALAAAAALLAANLLASARASTSALGLPARLVALGQVFLATGLVVALGTVLAEGPRVPFADPYREVLAVLLVAGWIGLTVSGALLHLLTVLQRVRRLTVAICLPRPGRDRLLSSLAALGVGALALSQLPGLHALGVPAAVTILALAAPLAGRVLVLSLRTLLESRMQEP